MRRSVEFALESLELRRLLAANPVISEFMAKNSTTIKDGNGNYSDWIELQNTGDAIANLQNYHLTDDSGSPAKWTFPQVSLPAGAYLLVFADGTGLTDPAGYLHTNFSLSTDGEALQLTDPNNVVVSSFGTNAAPYPPQSSDISYGTATIGSTLVGPKSPVRVIVPKDSTLDNGSWTQPSFDDRTWTSGTSGVGFDTQAPETISPSTPALAADWTGDSLNSLANNATVSTWTSSVGGTVATKNSSGAPKLVKNALNGHSVVKFDPTDGTNDQLRVPAASNPMAGVGDFSVAVVFQTATAGVGNADQWYNNSGIVDAEQGGVTNDWGIAFDKSGRVGGGVGNIDTTLYSDTGLNNNLAHVAVFTRSGTTTTLTIDNGTPLVGSASGTTRNVADMVFGSIQTNLDYFNGRIAEVRIYKGALSADATRQVGAQLSTTYGVSQDPSPISGLINTNIQAAMSGQATTALIRAPFTVDTSNALSSLTLNIQYDDGFIAYLNGTKIASRNTPTTIDHTSVATVSRTLSQTLTSESIDLSSYLYLLRGNGSTNVLSFRALNSSINDPDLLIAPQLVIAAAANSPAYMTSPTPGAANSLGYADIVNSVTFSKPHGNYTSTFTTDLTTTTPGATIVYTTDDSDPTLTNGVVLAAGATGHITIDSTTTVRAAAFLDGYLQSYISAASYIFLANVITQPNTAPADAFWGNTSLDTRVTGSAQTYTMAQALAAIPTISFTLPNDQLFGSRGIYFNPTQEGDEWERQASVEYFDPNNATDQFQVDAGLRMEGGASRSTGNPKQSFRLIFRSQYGTSTLNYPLFPGETTDTTFDHLVLRATHNYSWGSDGSSIADYTRDEFARELSQKLSGHGLVGKYVQLYLNGQYWGLYNLVEDIDTTWLSNQYGGSDDDYDLVEPDDSGGMEVKDGSGDGYTSLFNTLAADMADGSISNAEYDGLKPIVDMQSIASYMLNDIYRGDRDSPTFIDNSIDPRNFYAYRDHATNGPWKFTVWDGEFSMDDVNNDTTERSYLSSHLNPGLLYADLRSNPEFVQLMSDTAFKAFNNNGPLQVSGLINNPRALYASIANKIDAAIEGESARWGDALKSGTPFMRTDWLTEINQQENSYLPARSTIVYNQLKNDLPPLNVLPATTSINGLANDGGQVDAGSILTLLDPNATATGDVIYYTLDGTDPRAEGGASSSTALSYSSAITLNSSKTINLRILHNGFWSPLKTSAYAVSIATLHVSELMYNPPAPPVGSSYKTDDFEYIELVNSGTTTLDLSNLYFSNGIAATIAAGVTLAPGARGVIAKTPAAFQSRYGASTQILGSYPDKLSDNGEEVTLVDPNNPTTPIFDFTYGAKLATWFPAADGTGYSLEPIDPTAPYTNLNAPSGWRTSFAVNGSPGVAARFAGTTVDDRYDLRKNPTTGNLEIVLNNVSPTAPATYTLVPAAADSLVFDLGNGNDTVDVSSNADSIFKTLQFIGGAGSDTLQINTTAPTTLTSAAATIGTSTISFQSIESLSLGSNAVVNSDLGALNVAVTVGTTMFSSTQHLASLSISNGASAVLTAGQSRLLRVGGLSIDPSSTLDLNDHDMIVDSTSASTLSTVQGLIRQAYARGAWTGTGLFSTAAKDASPANKTLGSMTAADYWSLYGNTATFDSELPTNGSAVLVKYALFGDADFNGKVDSKDYNHIDVGYQTQGNAGFVDDWFNGDFNYDGKIDSSDYALIDQTYQTQGSTPLVTTVVAPPATAKSTKVTSGGGSSVRVSGLK